MNIAQIEQNLQQLITDFDKATTTNFIYDLLQIYDTPKSTIKRLQDGGLNLSKIEGEIAWKKQLFFKAVQKEDLYELFERIKTTERATKHNPRFVILTDYEKLLALDTKNTDSLDITLTDLPKHFDFFLPWAGMEKAQVQYENPADVKAAERMARLYDEITKDNRSDGSAIATKEEVHNLNVFLSRLLFCFFAEDTGIFEKGIFTNSISSHTQADGSDLHSYLDRLFEVLNTSDQNRSLSIRSVSEADQLRSVSEAELPAYLLVFPYVNGGLFRNPTEGRPHHAPIFSRRSRQILIESGELDWSAINPDIFGSMIQAVITPEHRGGLGMHYTSVPNIMKVIEPLFLDELYAEFNNAKAAVETRHALSLQQLQRLLKRIWNIKIFDPACGSGNFLIIAYKELRKLEMAIFREIDRINQSFSTQYSGIHLGNFYGIELDDFAHEVAILSLWLAEHQMNQSFFKEFGRTRPALPLKETGNIVHGNACRVDWESVCPKLDGDEIYILGNPPYLGARILDEEQKKDMKLIFDGKVEGYNDLDYIACWFFKGGSFIKNNNVQCAFVSTNSICQGSQVPNLWSNILIDKVEIGFVHKSFKWTNNAKSNAAVIVIILGLRNTNNKPKFIFENSVKKSIKNISPYLIEGENIYVYSRRNCLSNLPAMNFGSMPNDGGYLTLNQEEYNSAIEKNDGISLYLKRMMGSYEFINDVPRWCIWIEDEFELENAIEFDFIRERIEKVKQHRLASDRGATKLLADVSHRFAEVRFKITDSIIVPRHSSERREYIPMGFLSQNFVIADSALAIYDVSAWHFSMLNSRIHMTWIRAIAGRLKSDYRYSAALCYNTFPFFSISERQKQELEESVYRILEEREAHSEKTLAQLYDPDKMPEGLREAHRQNDLVVERCYRSKPFESDEERLEYLFKLYEQMIAEEKAKGTLFEMEKKSKPRIKQIK